MVLKNQEDSLREDIYFHLCLLYFYGKWFLRTKSKKKWQKSLYFDLSLVNRLLRIQNAFSVSHSPCVRMRTWLLL